MLPADASCPGFGGRLVWVPVMAQHSHAPLPDAPHARGDEELSAQIDLGWDHVRDAARIGRSGSRAATEPGPDAPDRLDAFGQQMRLKEAYPTNDRQGAAGAAGGDGGAPVRNDDERIAQRDFGWDHIRGAARVGAGGPRAIKEPGADASGPLASVDQRMRLKEAHPSRGLQGPPGAAGAAIARKAVDRGRRVLPRILKTAAGCLIVALAGFVPVHRYLQLASTEAIVTTHVITVRTPIDGQIDQLSKVPEVGTPIKTGAVLLRISNRRADRGRLDDLRRLVDLVEGERSAFSERLELLRSQEHGLVEQTQAFQRGRIRQLEERVAEIESQIAAAAATRTEAGAALLRTSILTDNGIQTKAAHDRAERDDAVAQQAEAALRRRLASVKIELEAARQGTFVGDSYNDRPSSSQHADEVVLRIGELQAELRAREERLAHLRGELTAEIERFADQSAVELTAPVSGSVWETLAAPGEEVRHGQDLMRLLDCSAEMVTAAVNERVYEQLHVGDPTHFRLLDDSTDYRGQVIRLGGLAAPSDNWALGSSAFAKDLFRVTVSISEIKEPGCAVGRTGRVMFEPKQASDADGSIASRLLGLLGLQ
jgi:multidrug resistance efflux pump